MLSVRAPGKDLTLTLSFPVHNRFSSISANIESPTMRHVPVGKGSSDECCLLFVKAMYLSWYFLRTSGNYSSHDIAFFNGGMTPNQYDQHCLLESVIARFFIRR